MSGFESIQEAIFNLGETQNSRVYCLACEYLVDNRGKLTHRVIICRPSGSDKNDPAWDKVKRNSRPRCVCGRNRVILPETRRFEASDDGELTISPGEKVLLKPIEGNREDAYMKLWINEMDTEGIVTLHDPFDPLTQPVTSSHIPGHSFKELEEWIQEYNPRENPEKLVMLCHNFPVFQFLKVDPEKKTIVIVLGRGVEALYE